MKTRVCRMYGQNDLRIETDEVIGPGPGQVLVAVAKGGICGSDMHYLADGGIGTIRVREPIILGHEASGRIVAIGEGVANVVPGNGVALNPSRPCGQCEFCLEGAPIHCMQMRFNGSAIRLPHEQGLFRDYVVVDAAQCIPVPSGVDLGAIACAEPLAVCLHAANLAGDLTDKRVLVTGAGAIGGLCVAVAVQRGAKEVVVTDIQDKTLLVARQMGAGKIINVGRNPKAMDHYGENKGHFHVAFECSAAVPAILTAISVLRPQGTLVQVGVAGETPFPINALVSKEIRVQGTHRFDTEFAEAVDAIASGRIDVGPMITSTFPVEEASRAFLVASDRSKSVKVQLSFDGTS